MPTFEVTEMLYRRYLADHFQNGQLLPSAIGFRTGPSFNRGRFSQPEHVLHKDCCDGKELIGWGALECLVEAVPSPVVSDDGRSFVFFPKHRPLPTCYAHTELWCNEGDSLVDYHKEPPRSVREKFRVQLARRLRVCIPAIA